MTDKAEKLHDLIVKLNETNNLQLTKGGRVADLPLWQAFEPIAKALGGTNYAEFRDNFVSLCRAVRRDVETVPLGKETVRAGWLSCLDQVESVFDARNFPQPTQTVFANHFGGPVLSTIDTISERLHSSGYQDSNLDELDAAMLAVSEAIEEFQKSGKLPPSVANLLKAYLRQMESTYHLAEDFGDDLFWKTYKETFATFIEIMKIVEGASNEPAIRAKFAAAAGILANKAVAGISLGANLVTVAAYLAPYVSS